MTLRIGVVGALTIDVNRSGESYYRYVGGGGFYSSISLSDMGVETILLTAYGPDMEREWVEQISRRGVKILNIGRLERSIFFENTYVGSVRLQKSNGEPPVKMFIDGKMFKGLHAIHVTPVFNEVDPNVIREASEAGCKVSVDAQGFIRSIKGDGHVRNVWRTISDELLRYVDYLHMNLEEQLFFLRSNVKELMELNPRMIIEITDSEHGSFVMDRHGCYRIPAFETSVVDPTGAGDVYASVFLAKHVENGDLLESGLYASTSASLKVEKPGYSYRLDMQEVNCRVGVLRRILEDLY
ncbi:MAG: carbohydrate kinase family protein [Thermoproteota archaeon]